jgi:FMN phosphatase YigB (HAD superfamily)
LKSKAIICDLDGTLANINHRLHHSKGGDWDEFHEAGKDDPINEWCKELVSLFHDAGYYVLIVSARPSEQREPTIKWIEEHLGWKPGDNYSLFLKDEGDGRKDFEVKKTIWERDLKDNYNVLFAVDDRNRIADLWRSLGLKCLLCDDWDDPCKKKDKEE